MNKKTFVILDVLLLLVLMFVLLRPSRSKYFIAGQTKLVYKNNEWQYVEDNKNILNRSYKIYDKSTLIGTYQIDEYNYMLGYKKDDIFYSMKNDNYAVSGFVEFEVANTKIEELNSDDLNELSKVLIKKGISNYESLSTNEKIVYDIDNDGKEETIYNVSNYLNGHENEKKFFLIYIIDKDDMEYLVSEIYDSYSSYKKYEIESLLRFDSSDDYNILLKYDDSEVNLKYMCQKKSGTYELIKYEK